MFSFSFLILFELKKGNIATKLSRAKQKMIEEEPCNDDALVMSKKFPFDKERANVKSKQKRQTKQITAEIGVIGTSNPNKKIDAKSKKVREPSKTKPTNKTTDHQNEKETRKKKSSSTPKGINGEVGKRKKENIPRKKNVSKATAVQNDESLEEDVDIITMYNDAKSKKTLKKKVLEKSSHSAVNKKTKEGGKNLDKGKSVKSGAKNKRKGFVGTQEENSNHADSPTGKGNINEV